jgi:hypothetical protein
VPHSTVNKRTLSKFETHSSGTKIIIETGVPTEKQNSTIIGTK